jgi:outer membrane protein assembly factor BamB
VATALGVFRLDRELAATGAPIARLSGNYAAAPVVTAKHVYAVSTDGILHWASQDGDEVEQTLSLQAEGGASTNWSTAPLLGDERLVIASPSGSIIRVTLGEPHTVLKAEKTSGGATEGAVATDGEGAIYLPTNIGVYRLPKTAGALQFFGSAPVSQTPIGTASGAMFLDDGGTLHAVRLATTETEPGSKATSVSGAKLTTQRGPLASVDGARFLVASGKSLQRITVNDIDDTKGPVLDSVGGDPLFSATAPIAAAPAVDSSGVVFVASTDGVLYVVDPLGSILDSYLTDGALVAQPALSEDAVYVGSLDGNVYRFGAEAVAAGGAAGSDGGGSAGMAGSSGTSGSAGSGGAKAPAGGSAGSN